MNAILTVLSLLSGVALFLFGMSLMGEGLSRVAGKSLERILFRLTSTPIKGILLGAVVTAVIQSSSATTVMVVGFVNSGMMKVAQAIGVIMGANIGTSITGWILCLSYIDGSSGIAKLLSTATISAVVAIIGIIFQKFMKKSVYKHIGSIMLGFAILMMGMQTMSGAVSPLRSNPTFVSLLTMFKNPLLGILIGIVFTAILQSASASVGILQALSMTGAISFSSAFPITLGIGVGAACPVLLSAIGTNRNGQRTALVYLMNDLLGMVIWGTIFYVVNMVVHFPFMDYTMSPVTVALLNTVYRILTMVVLSPFIGAIEKLVFTLIKKAPEEEEKRIMDFELLEEHFLNYPDIAISRAEEVMNNMAKKTRKNVNRAVKLMNQYEQKRFEKINRKEDLIDMYEDRLQTYLLNLSKKQLTSEQTRIMTKQLHAITDYERIADHAVNLAKVAAEMEEKQLRFSDMAQEELKAVESAVIEVLDLTVNAYMSDNLLIAEQVEPLREWIKVLCGEMKSRHVIRLQQGVCDFAQGFAFNDLLTSFDRISAHCSNIAIAMIEMQEAEYTSHAYQQGIREHKDQKYLENYAAYAKAYSIENFNPDSEVETEIDDEE